MNSFAQFEVADWLWIYMINIVVLELEDNKLWVNFLKKQSILSPTFQIIITIFTRNPNTIFLIQGFISETNKY